MSKFVTLTDNEVESIDITKQLLRFACCDCGMVHDMIFEVDGDALIYKMVQKPRASAQLRRHHMGNLHNGVGKWWLGRVPKTLKPRKCGVKT